MKTLIVDRTVARRIGASRREMDGGGTSGGEMEIGTGTGIGRGADRGEYLVYC